MLHALRTVSALPKRALQGSERSGRRLFTFAVVWAMTVFHDSTLPVSRERLAGEKRPISPAFRHTEVVVQADNAQHEGVTLVFIG
jgi:hypothetical protein